MSSKRKRQDRKPRRNSAPTRLELQLGEAQLLLDGGDIAEALELLETLDRTHPMHSGVLTLRVVAAATAGNNQLFHMVAQRLVKLLPNNAYADILLAESYLANGWMALTLQAYRNYVARWPDDEEAGRIRESITAIEVGLAKELEDAGLGGEVGFTHACMHEQVLSHMHSGQLAEARRIALRLLAIRPDYIPALNNLTEINIAEADYAAAADACRRVLDWQPENAFARGNLIRVLLLSGRRAEAAAEGESLKRLKPFRGDSWVKMAEALTFLGDDEGVLAVEEAASATADRRSPEFTGLMEHLSAVALYRLGREREARKRWQAAVEKNPHLVTARENLDGMDDSRGDGAGFAFHIRQWIPENIVAELRRWLTSGKGKKAAARETEGISRFLAARPDVAALIPVLLDRGDPVAQSFAVRLAQTVGTPDMLGALRDFALSKRGSQSLRLEAAQAASAACLIPPGPVRMWTDGEWRELLLLNFEIHYEPTGGLSKRGLELHEKGSDFLRSGNGVAAERVFRESLITDPDRPSTLNNLALALEQQGRFDEAREMICDVRQRFPDYLFGVVAMAKEAIIDSRLDEAQKLLDPLMARKRFHASEFSALAQAQIQLQLARGQREGAARWLEMLEGAVPDDRNLPALRSKVKGKFSLWPFGKK